VRVAEIRGSPSRFAALAISCGFVLNPVDGANALNNERRDIAHATPSLFRGPSFRGSPTFFCNDFDFGAESRESIFSLPQKTYNVPKNAKTVPGTIFAKILRGGSLSLVLDWGHEDGR